MSEDEIAEMIRRALAPHLEKQLSEAKAPEARLEAYVLKEILESDAVQGVVEAYTAHPPAREEDRAVHIQNIALRLLVKGKLAWQSTLRVLEWQKFAHPQYAEADYARAYGRSHARRLTDPAHPRYEAELHEAVAGLVGLHVARPVLLEYLERERPDLYRVLLWQRDALAEAERVRAGLSPTAGTADEETEEGDAAESTNPHLPPTRPVARPGRNEADAAQDPAVRALVASLPPALQSQLPKGHDFATLLAELLDVPLANRRSILSRFVERFRLRGRAKDARSWQEFLAQVEMLLDRATNTKRAFFQLQAVDAEEELRRLHHDMMRAFYKAQIAEYQKMENLSKEN